MEEKHRDLVRVAAAELAIRGAFDACKDGVSFADSWSIVKRRFESLHRFVGGISSAFFGTPQAESDFTIVKADEEHPPNFHYLPFAGGRFS